MPATEHVHADPSLLERNLSALAACSPETAALVRASAPRGDAGFCATDDGVLAASIGNGAAARWLCSRRRPLDEAARFAARFDPVEAGIAVIQGFGAGHHVRAVAEILTRHGVVVVFEPDAGLLRAVLERIDFTDILSRSNIIVLTRADDAGAISAALAGAEVMVSLGVRILDHAPSTPRLGESAARFGETLTTTIRAVRTNVVTTLMQTETSLRNGLMNLDHYTAWPGIGELAGCAAGHPAVVVSAGPSLRRNIDLLARPGVRDRVVIIAAQTVLRPLLEAGIRPHFVTALDYHEISARFYEGLTPADVEGVTLLVEPKANPAILDAFPGRIRCQHDTTLSALLGDRFTHDGARLEPGATVAHMAYTVARHLGCDPVILVGQDLGFTDGQYYSPGAAIHDVWGAELNEFNTLEMMEWQRVVRNRKHLHPATDHLGRPVYTDEQMSAYLVQFERMFAADVERGLAAIDATEGGVAKRHAVTATLADALDTYAPATLPALAFPSASTADAGNARPADLAPIVAERLDRLARDVASVGRISRKTHELLAEMRDHHDDQRRVNRLIDRVQENGREVRTFPTAFELVQHLNQTGQLNRFRADRALHLAQSLAPMDVQRRQIERDLVNVDWLAESAHQVEKLLHAAAAAMRGEAPKLTRDPEEKGRADTAVTRTPVRLGAVIAVDPDRGSLGTPRDLARPLAAGRNALQITLERLARIRGLETIVLLAQDPERVRAIAGDALPANALIERTERHPLGDRRRGIARARAFAADCWRSGLAGMTVYDEAFDPDTATTAMERHGLDAALLCGPDWPLIDPELAGDIISRHLEDPEHNRFTFSQAAPGLAPCLVSRTLMTELASASRTAGAFASIGGLLGYIPRAAIMDPIAKPGCVRIDPVLRDLGIRAIADGPVAIETISRALSPADPAATSLPEAAPLLRAHAEQLAMTGPRLLTLELCAGRRTGGAISQLAAGNERGGDRSPMTPEIALTLIDELAAARPDAALTLAGLGDPLMHPAWREIVSHALTRGFAAVHVRTDLQCPREDALWLLERSVDITSVDLFAETDHTYRALAGSAGFDHARDNLIAMLEARAQTGAQSGAGSMPETWIVPRITRCDAVYGEIETFYDRWLTVAQACVIDPLPRTAPGDRIAPLPLPAGAAHRRDLTQLTVLSNGRALGHARAVSGRGIADTAKAGLVAAWRRVLRDRETRTNLLAHIRTPEESAAAAA